jgi:hypothetical protein
MPGTELDRYGSNFGRYLSPRGTPKTNRALPPSNSGPYKAYIVVKPFEVKSSVIAPYFGELGQGKQYFTPVSVNVLLKRQIIKPLN